MGRLGEKLTSGRFIVTIMMCTTYCYLVSFMVTKLSDKISGDFILGFIGGFSTSFVLIIQWYFQKENIVKPIQTEESNEPTKTIPNSNDGSNRPVTSDDIKS